MNQPATASNKRKTIMAQGSIHVTFDSPDASRIPDRLIEGVVLLLDLARRGVLEQIAERVRIRRQGGYCGLDVWLVLWLYFSTGAASGIRKFWEVLSPHKKKIAALLGRKSLASPSSISRALGAAETDLVREHATWLMVEMPEVDEVLQHPAAKSYDALGQGWHVFDEDPTVTGIRQRDLPEDDDLPEPRRRAEDTGAPGHSGRKRSDIQFRRIAVQHSGSSAWIHGHLSPGNGEGVVDFEPALDSIVGTCVRLDHPLDRSMVRMDGEHGNVPWFTACRERHLPFITRLNRPKLYEDHEVLAKLSSATWFRVPDSRSGPRRLASDLGEMTIHPGKRTRRPDGSTYEPITVRVVASIFPKTGKAKRGRVIDSWQVELFAVDLPADAWPAPYAIAAYFGRSAQENRFAQEDRELNLDRIVSYNLAGQELACLVGLSLWNLRLVRGFRMDRPPAERPVQTLGPPEVDDSVPAQWPRDPVVLDLLGDLDWETLLAKRPGWSWDAVAVELRCEDGRAMSLTSVRPREHAEGRTGIIFRRPKGGCEDCAPRADCLRSERTLATKHVEFSVSTVVAEKLRARLQLVRKPTEEAPTVAPIDAKPGPLVAMESLFLPAMARSTFCSAFLGASLNIEVEMPPLLPDPPRLVAIDVADRQRRRKTWQDNVARYAAPEGTKVHVEVAAGTALRRMLGDPDPAIRRARASG